MVHTSRAALRGWPLRSRRTALAAVTTTTLLGFAPVYAQQTVGNETTSMMEIQEIVVTGSRIRRADTATAAPVTVIDEQALVDRGFIQVGQALNEATAITPSNPVSQFDGSATNGGTQYPQLFGLGPGRTLSLVNGRRFVTSSGAFSTGFGNGTNDSVVDTNQIPIGLLRSVEIVQGGGAAVYGSDAMGGVINYLYKDDFEGLEVDTQYGQTFKGDNESPSARVTWGKNFADRGNIAVDFGWSRVDSLLPEQRRSNTRALAAISNPADTGPADGIPNVVRINETRFWEFSDPGVLFYTPNPAAFPIRNFITTNNQLYNSVSPAGPGGIPAQFSPDGQSLVAYNPGVFPGVGPSIPFSSGGDGYDYRRLSSLSPEVERATANVIGHFDITEKTRFTWELLYSNVQGTDPRSQSVSNTILNNATTGSQAITLKATNAFISPAVRQSIISFLNATNPIQGGPPANQGNIWASGAAFPISISKNWVDLLPTLEGEREVSTARGVLGLEGDFSAADRDFYWNVSASYANVDGEIKRWGVIQSNYLKAIDSVLVNGTPTCAVNADANTTNDDAACSPINPFGVGNVSDAARNYVSGRFGQEYENTQQDYLATLGGDVVTLPGGLMRFSVALEHREEEAEFDPSAADQAALGRGQIVASLPQKADYDTNEYSLELLVPIFGEGWNFPGAKAVELTTAYRFVDNSIAGTEDVWNAGLRWSVVDDLTLRVSRSRNFRAPNLTQLFAPASSQPGAIVIDPCDADRIGGGPNPAARLANCQALFAANPQFGPLATFQDVNENVSGAIITSQGNPNLKNEISDTTSYGFILQPRWVEGLTLIVDRVQIDLEDGLSQFTPQNFLQTCFDSTVQPTAICALSTRDPNTGFVTNSVNQTINAGFIKYRGEVYSVNYAFDVGDGARWGKLALTTEATHTSELKQSVTGFDLTRLDGSTSQPDWRVRFDARYDISALRLAYTLDYLPEVLSRPNDTIETTPFPNLSENFMHSLSAQYDLTDYLTVRAGVENFTDEKPSFPNATYGDYLGRRFYVGARAKFQ